MKYYNWLRLRKRNRAGELNTTQSIQVDFSPLADWHLCGDRLTPSTAALTARTQLGWTIKQTLERTPHAINLLFG